MRLRHDLEKALHWPRRRIRRMERHADGIEKRAGRLLRLSIALRNRRKELVEVLDKAEERKV